MDEQELVEASNGQFDRYQKKLLASDIIRGRTNGETVREACDRLGLTVKQYHTLMRGAAKDASKHLSDEVSVYLLNVFHRLDRATQVVTDELVANKDYRAANALANLVNATASLSRVIVPEKMRDAGATIPGGDLPVIAARLGISIPPPLLGQRTT